MKTKKHVREEIKELFLQYTREELDTKDSQIIEEVLKYIEKRSVQNICIYENMIDEVSTDKLINTLRAKKISIFTPQVIGENEMILIDEDYEHYEKEIDIFIIPGRAFSHDGKRLGRGKGYYDRFLSQKIYKTSKKVGICYDFQISTEIKTEKHDISMNQVVTNKEC